MTILEGKLGQENVHARGFGRHNIYANLPEGGFFLPGFVVDNEEVAREVMSGMDEEKPNWVYTLGPTLDYLRIQTVNDVFFEEGERTTIWYGTFNAREERKMSLFNWLLNTGSRLWKGLSHV